MDYIKRIADIEIDKRVEVFDAIQIVGPKGSGKTRTASERAKTIIAFEDQKRRSAYLKTAKEDPTLFLQNEKPILFDEWQDAPEVWDMVRWECDQTDNVGEFFLTGSSAKDVTTAHTGTGRITTLKMLPMSLMESGESNGSVSLSEIFNNPEYEVRGQKCNMSMNDLFYLTCRGGWPNALKRKDQAGSLLIAKDLEEQIYQRDASAIDGVKRDPDIVKTMLRSLARNICMPVQTGTVLGDVSANYPISDITFYDYARVLKMLYVTEEIPAWRPDVRSKTAIRSTSKKIFIDPSIACASLNLSPDFFRQDLNLFGHFFENLVLRDLLVYSAPLRGTLRHYRDDYGLEVDAVLELADGRYALIEIKLGAAGIEEGEQSLLKLSSLIDKANSKRDGTKIRKPDHLLLIAGSIDTAYTTRSGVKIIPLGCLGI